jgi:hypothetical protein
MSLGTGFVVIRKTKPFLAFFAFKHSSAYQAVNIEIMRMNMDFKPNNIKPSFEAISFEEIELDIKIRENDDYWNLFARELVIGIVGSLREL